MPLTWEIKTNYSLITVATFRRRPALNLSTSIYRLRTKRSVAGLRRRLRVRISDVPTSRQITGTYDDERERRVCVWGGGIKYPRLFNIF